MTHSIDASVTQARAQLLEYFDRHARDLPWRRTRDPYAIWVSEIMLQQTRVETVIPYYQRFLERFPTTQKLADAPLDSVLTAWSGLGYYRRARMLHAGARAVVADHAGELPRDPARLLSLPGVGAYTAGAIASIAFGLCEPVVDGNVERVLTRWRGLSGDPKSRETKPLLWSLARELANGSRPGDLNQALMEVGATLCTPTSPNCLLCPLRQDCVAKKSGNPARFPEKKPRANVRHEKWSALVLLSRNRKRVHLELSSLGRWEEMLVPPLTQDVAVASLKRAWMKRYGMQEVTKVGEIVHVLTHAVMEVTVYRAEVLRDAKLSMTAIEKLDERAVPKVTRVILACAMDSEPSVRAAPRGTSRTENPTATARRRRA